MENTNHLNLPYIMANQAQKHVTHNEALRMLDAIAQISVAGTGLDEPPANPEEGDRYIIGANPVALWQEHPGHLAVFVDGAWMFHEPGEGWLVWDQPNARLNVFHNAVWEPVGNDIGPGAEIDDIAFLGINGPASSTERFVVQSASALFNHDGDDHRIKINKASEDKTASLVFQSGFSGRAEFGLAGEDAFSVKVSPDGSNWHRSLVADPQDGSVDFPVSGVAVSPDLVTNLLPDSGRFNPLDQQSSINAPLAQAPVYLEPYNGALFKFPFRFKNDNSSFGGTQGPLNPVVRTLIETVHGIEGARYGPEFWCMKIEAGTGMSSAITIDGQTFHRAANSFSGLRPYRYTSGFFIRSELGNACIIPPRGELRKLTRSGVPANYGTVDVLVNPADGWVYFEMQVTSADHAGDPNDMAVHLEVGGSCYFALPRLISGWVTPGMNRALVPNSQIISD